MRKTDPDTLMFFDAHPKALPVYQAFEELLLDTFSPVNKRVQKTQISIGTCRCEDRALSRKVDSPHRRQ